jgi:hypothetical protein
VKLAAARHGHAAAYHGVRAPAYLALTAWWALVGVGRTAAQLLAWWHVPDLSKLEHQAAADGLLSDHLRIHKAGREIRTVRGLMLAGCAVVVVAALVILSKAPVWAWVLLGAVWPEPVTSEHAGRLELWVGRQDVSKARQAPWPLLRGGQADVFQPIPFGTDVRGRTVKVPLVYHN